MKTPEKETWCQQRGLMSENDSLSLSYSTFKCGCPRVYILSVNTVVMGIFLSFFLLVYYIFMCVMDVYCVPCTHMEVRGHLQDLAVSFRHMDARDWIQVIKLSNKCPYMLSILLALAPGVGLWLSVVRYTSGYLLSISCLILLLCNYLHFP